MQWDNKLQTLIQQCVAQPLFKTFRVTSTITYSISSMGAYCHGLHHRLKGYYNARTVAELFMMNIFVVNPRSGFFLNQFNNGNLPHFCCVTHFKNLVNTSTKTYRRIIPKL